MILFFVFCVLFLETHQLSRLLKKILLVPWWRNFDQVIIYWYKEKNLL